jgi:polyisoprenoid-binding protein YceI
MSTQHAAHRVDAPAIEKTIWRIDPARSSVEFRTETFWGIATVKGRFSRYHGTLDLSGEPAVELTVEVDSLNTKNDKRDKHLRSPDFFAAEEHPYVRFVSESAALDGDRLAVRGLLHARGAGIPLATNAVLRRVGDELEIEAVAAADHVRLGMTFNRLRMIRTPSELVVRGRLVRDA